MFRAKTFFRYFPTPKFLEMPCVGIDISSYSMRFIEIVKGNDSLKVGRFAESHFTTPFLVGEGDNAEVKETLKRWKKQFNLDYVEASIPEEKAYLFKTEIEIETDEKMRNVIEFNLEENVPLSGAEAIFDYRIISSSISNGRASVMVTVLPRTVIEGYISLLKECGLVPLSFLIEAQAISKALIKKDDLGTYLIVNINQKRTGFFIVSQGSVQFSSTIPIGSGDFTAALMKQFALSEEAAEKMKKEKGFTRSKENEEVLNALMGTASAFRQEIEKVYVYWHTHKSSDGKAADEVRKILLCGRGATITGFKEFISQNMKVETDIGNVWTNVASFDEYIPPIKAEDALNFASSIGVALPKLY